MRYCTNCGSEVSDYADICINCGATIRKTTASKADASSAGYGILSFFFPIIGLILWLVWRKDFPLKAKSAGIGALIGIIIGVLASI